MAAHFGHFPRDGRARPAYAGVDISPDPGALALAGLSAAPTAVQQAPVRVAQQLPTPLPAPARTTARQRARGLSESDAVPAATERRRLERDTSYRDSFFARRGTERSRRGERSQSPAPATQQPVASAASLPPSAPVAQAAPLPVRSTGSQQAAPAPAAAAPSTAVPPPFQPSPAPAAQPVAFALQESAPSAQTAPVQEPVPVPVQTVSIQASAPAAAAATVPGFAQVAASDAGAQPQPPAQAAAQEPAEQGLEQVAALIASLPVEEERPAPVTRSPEPARSTPSAPRTVTAAPAEPAQRSRTPQARRASPAAGEGRTAGGADTARAGARAAAARGERETPARSRTADARKGTEGAPSSTARAATERTARSRTARPAHPSRHWIQLSLGPNADVLPREFTRLKAKAPAVFGSRTPYTVAVRANHRLLVGPFDDEAAARAFMNQLAREDVASDIFVSEAGQEIARLSTPTRR